MSSYLDYNATTPIDPRVLETMIEVYTKNPGNADSRTHTFGDDARRAVETARADVASLLGVNKDEVFFTSGATESNNIAIQGLKEYAEKNGKKRKKAEKGGIKIGREPYSRFTELVRRFAIPMNAESGR